MIFCEELPFREWCERCERAVEQRASNRSNLRLSVIEAELQSGQSPIELAEFPLGSRGWRVWMEQLYDWLGLADGNDDVITLIVPRMPHHVAPRRSSSLPLFLCPSLWHPFHPPVCRSTGLGKNYLQDMQKRERFFY